MVLGAITPLVDDALEDALELDAAPPVPPVLAVLLATPLPPGPPLAVLVLDVLPALDEPLLAALPVEATLVDDALEPPAAMLWVPCAQVAPDATSATRQAAPQAVTNAGTRRRGLGPGMGPSAI